MLIKRGQAAAGQGEGQLPAAMCRQHGHGVGVGDAIRGAARLFASHQPQCQLPVRVRCFKGDVVVEDVRRQPPARHRGEHLDRPLPATSLDTSIHHGTTADLVWPQVCTGLARVQLSFCAAQVKLRRCLQQLAEVLQGQLPAPACSQGTDASIETLARRPPLLDF